MVIGISIQKFQIVRLDNNCLIYKSHPTPINMKLFGQKPKNNSART